MDDAGAEAEAEVEDLEVEDEAVDESSDCSSLTRPLVLLPARLACESCAYVYAKHESADYGKEGRKECWRLM